MVNLQKGIATNILIALVAGVVVVGGILYFVFSGTSSDQVKTPANEESVQNETTIPQTPSPEESATESAAPEEAADVTVEIEASNFKFSKDTVTVKKGQTVKVVLTSSEGFHDWVIDEFDAGTERINAGQISEITFLADQVGEFEYYCSVGSHRQMGMVGTLVVTE